MNAILKTYLVETFGLAKDADDAAAKTLLGEKLKSGELSTDKYTELLTAKESGGKAKADELADAIASKTAGAVATALAPALTELTKALQGRGSATPEEKKEPEQKKDAEDVDAKLAAMEAKLKAHYDGKPVGGDGAALMKMAHEYASDDAESIRVKGSVERFRDQKTALVYRSDSSKNMIQNGRPLHGQPMMHNGQEVNQSTERTKMMSAVWAKLQIAPELMKDWEMDIVRHILHKEKFLVPNSRNDTAARLLTEQERFEVLDGHLKFYLLGKAVINDSTSGGQYAVPEFFDYDMITTPTLAMEDIPSHCHIIPVPRGSAAQNFTLGRPTLAAANTEGSGVNLFTTTGFIGNHDTTFFRAAGFTEIGINFAQDAHPGLVPEILNQYMLSYRLWLNEQICTGDGTTEPQGIMNASGTTNVTPTTPTTGPIVLADVLEMMFGVSKAYRFNGGLQNFCYIMTDTTYYRIRAIATGVTGDTRLVFGMDVNGYSLFNQPVLIEQAGMANDYMIAAQLKGYRLYMRQGPRFVREDRGKTLVLANTFIVGLDCRVGGQLDLGPYAAVATGFMT